MPRLTILIPNLFDYIREANQRLETEHLALLLSKANETGVEECSVESPIESSTEEPLSGLAMFAKLSRASSNHAQSRAALSLFSSQEPSDSWLCYAAPIIMHPNRDHLSIAAAKGLGLDTSEARSFCTELNDYFSADGLRFSFVQPDIWYCQSATAFDVSSHAPMHIIGENVIGYLAQTQINKHSRRYFNEVQMLLHNSETNKVRVSKGKLAINSLWFWAGGHLPNIYKSPFDQVFTNDTEVKGLAKLGQVSVDELPADLHKQDLWKHKKPLIYIDLFERTDELIRINNYMQHVHMLLEVQKIREVRIVTNVERQFRVNKKDLSKFWRLKRDINAFT